VETWQKNVEPARQPFSVKIVATEANFALIPERTRVQHVAQHLKQQSQPLHRSQLQTRYGMTGTVQTQEGGGVQGGRSPPELFNSFECRSHCKDQAAISDLVEQEQWGAEGVQPPLNRSHYIRYNFNANCSAGSAPFFVFTHEALFLDSLFSHILVLVFTHEALFLDSLQWY